MSYEPVDGLSVSLDGGVLRLELSRPEKRNALSDQIMRSVADNIEQAGTDETVRAIVVSGAGEHFCGGADIVSRNTGPSDGHEDRRPRTGSIQRRLPTTAHRLIQLVLSVQTPVLCRVQGYAVGIGFQLAMAADVTIASTDATFWEPFTQRGFTPDSGATWLLTRLAGPVRARELLLLGRRLTGAEAHEWGLVHRAVDPNELDSSVESIVAQLASGPTVALGLTKRLLLSAQEATLEAQLQDEAFALELSSRTEDFREGLRAFAERREPTFEGR